jgi:hypothetical protein
MAIRTDRSFSIPAPRESLEKRAVGLYKLLRFLLPRRLLLEFCVAPYKTGVVCLQLFDLLLEQLKLGAKKGDVLLEHDRRAVLNDEPFNLPKDR